MQLDTVGEIVRVLRSRRDLEQVELARACGWRDASAVSRIETDRIKPTQRTLQRLAQALADPKVTGTAEEVRAWLFLAAGLLPTPNEVAALDAQLPPIERWPQPAMIRDFGWNLWRANDLMVALLGLPENHRGRNYLEMVFVEPGVRAALGEHWEMGAKAILRQFKEESAGRTEQRWHRKLMARLHAIPGFDEIWADVPDPSPTQVYNRVTEDTPAGPVAVLRLRITADPRLVLINVLPEDDESARALREAGALLR